MLNGVYLSTKKCIAGILFSVFGQCCLLGIKTKEKQDAKKHFTFASRL